MRSALQQYLLSLLKPPTSAAQLLQIITRYLYPFDTRGKCQASTLRPTLSNIDQERPGQSQCVHHQILSFSLSIPSVSFNPSPSSSLPVTTAHVNHNFELLPPPPLETSPLTNKAPTCSAADVRRLEEDSIQKRWIIATKRLSALPTYVPLVTFEHPIPTRPHDRRPIPFQRQHGRIGGHNI